MLECLSTNTEACRTNWVRDWLNSRANLPIAGFRKPENHNSNEIKISSAMEIYAPVSREKNEEI